MGLYKPTDTHHWSLERRPHLIAHRGASLFAAENSPEAIEEASRRGATDVEIDVNMTSDGVLVAVHDGLLSADSVRWISQVTADELDKSVGYKVHRLSAILETVAASDLGLYLDVKQLLPGGAALLRSELERYSLVERSVAASFRSDIAATLKRDAALVTSFLFLHPGIDLHSLVRRTGVDFVHPCFNELFDEPLVHFDARWVNAVLALDVGIITWNTLDEDVARAVLELGAHGVCSDDPAVLVSAARNLSI